VKEWTLGRVQHSLVGIFTCFLLFCLISPFITTLSLCQICELSACLVAMAERIELNPTGTYHRRLQNKGASNDADVDDVNTTASNDTDRQRELSLVAPLPLPARPLSQRDVASLIINKMIGTGIFTAPPSVLLMARSRSLAFGLWLLGFAYTIVR
jgi:hypothetical protein